MRERFWAKVDRRGDDECWPWTGWRDKRGYGGFKADLPDGTRRHRKASAVAWELENGRPTPDDKQIDHFFCGNPPCCNPRHLRPEDPAVNNRREKRESKECVRGHPYAEHGRVVTHNSNGYQYRQCMKCRKEDAPAAVARRREQRRAARARATTGLHVP